MTTLDERLFASTVATLELFSVYVGARLHLFDVLAEQGPMTAIQLAAAADIHPRYAREWLEQQAVAGLLSVEDVGQPADQRIFALPAEHRAALVDVDELAHLAPLAHMVVGVAGVLDRVVDAYRTGEALLLPPTIVSVETVAAAESAAALVATPGPTHPVEPWLVEVDGTVVVRADLPS